MSPRAAKPAALSFEQATARLEEIVALTEDPETGLEEMIALVAEGQQLIRSSRKLLQEAELKIQQLEAPEPAAAATPAPQDDEFSLL